MIYGHGDDGWRYKGIIQANFSSNCYNEADNSALHEYLREQLSGLTGSYPHPDGSDLKEVIGKRYRIPVSRIAVFNGATEAIYSIARDCGYTDSVIAGPTFSEYQSAARLYKHTVQLLYQDKEELEASLSRLHTPTMVWICNPNNPNGKVYPRKALEQLISAYPEHLFIVDQSYAPFTVLETLENNPCFPNLILIHSLTKRHNIPGLRLGYVTAAEKWISVLEKNRMPWSVNAVALSAGSFLIEREQDFTPTVHELRKEVVRMQQAFEETGAITCYPSDTHYFLSSVQNGNAALLKERLATRYGLLIRNAENFAPHYGGYFRIAVKDPVSNDKLIRAIQAEIAEIVR